MKRIRNFSFFVFLLLAAVGGVSLFSLSCGQFELPAGTVLASFSQYFGLPFLSGTVVTPEQQAVADETCEGAPAELVTAPGNTGPYNEGSLFGAAQVFFFVLAIINEIVWRTQSTDIWVTFKAFGVIPLTAIFAVTRAMG